MINSTSEYQVAVTTEDRVAVTSEDRADLRMSLSVFLSAPSPRSLDEGLYCTQLILHSAACDPIASQTHLRQEQKYIARPKCSRQEQKCIAGPKCSTMAHDLQTL